MIYKAKLLTAPLLTLALLIASCGQIEEALRQEEKTWRGTWKVNSVTLDGESYPTYAAVWTLNDNDWRLVTSVCQAQGPLSSDGSNLTLTVESTTCPETLPAPEGRSASGPADVNGDSMTFTLRHTLDGVEHTLVSVCKRQ